MSIPTALRELASGFRSLVYPAHCACCEAPLDGAGGEGPATAAAADPILCAACAAAVHPLRPPFCATCSQPFYGAISGPFTCTNCGDRRFNFTCAVSRYLSRGPVRDLIHQFKYGRQFHLRHQLGRWLAETAADPRLAADPPDLIVPVPLHPTRKREREFNQAEVLARSLARTMGLPVAGLLRRVRPTTTQTRLDREERSENLRDAFRLRENRPVRGKSLLLVDDVFTTGSTADACARVLAAAGAREVRVATVARG